MDADRARWRKLHRAASEELAGRLEAAFAPLLAATRRDPARLAAAPAGGGWTALETLEHVALATQYLLVLAAKVRDRSRARLERGEPWPDGPPALAAVAAAARDPRPWEAPAHMVPTGEVPPEEVRRRLAGALERALALLREMPSGEGTLHRIRMSRVAEGEDRLDLLGWLELVARHAERHASQVERALSTPAGPAP